MRCEPIRLDVIAAANVSEHNTARDTSAFVILRKNTAGLVTDIKGFDCTLLIDFRESE